MSNYFLFLWLHPLYSESKIKSIASIIGEHGDTWQQRKASHTLSNDQVPLVFIF